MRAPQIIFIVLMSVNVFLSLMKHGEPRNDKYNVWISLLNTAIYTGLLWWGGFFS